MATNTDRRESSQRRLVELVRERRRRSSLVRADLDLVGEEPVVADQVVGNETEIRDDGVDEVEDPGERRGQAVQLARQEAVDVQARLLRPPGEFGDDAWPCSAQVDDGEAVRRVEAAT